MGLKKLDLLRQCTKLNVINWEKCWSKLQPSQWGSSHITMILSRSTKVLQKDVLLWSMPTSLVERDELLDRPNSEISSTAYYHLGRYSLHLLLVTRSISRQISSKLLRYRGHKTVGQWISGWPTFHNTIV